MSLNGIYKNNNTDTLTKMLKKTSVKYSKSNHPSHLRKIKSLKKELASRINKIEYLLN